MKTSIVAIAIVASLPAYTNDMQAYLDHTEELVRQGKNQKALERFIWFHDHALEHDPAMCGVRLSFALMYWKGLGDVYPPARTALQETRNKKTLLLVDSKGDAYLFGDVAALNWALGEGRKTVDLFDLLDKKDPALASQCWTRAKDAVQAAHREDLVQKYAGQDAESKRPSNELPMYGGEYTPDVTPNKTVSAEAAKLGWKYYYQGDLDTAIKRFNQAWMYDHESADAFWGFGLIVAERANRDEDADKNIKDSVDFLEKARKKVPKNAGLLVDLAMSYTLLGQSLKEGDQPNAAAEFGKARELFETAEKLDPKYPLVYANRSILDFYAGDYLMAKQRLDKAIGLGFKPDPNYVKDLESKLKQP